MKSTACVVKSGRLQPETLLPEPNIKELFNANKSSGGHISVPKLYTVNK